MALSELSRQLRQLLDDPSDAQPAAQLSPAIDAFIHEYTTSSEPDVLQTRLDDELLTIHKDLVDHTSPRHVDSFLTVLQELSPILSPCSLISTWFDIILRPALRDPKLPDGTVNRAKELILSALQRRTDDYYEKIKDFRRRLMDLYLLDVHNEISGEDVLEWAALDQEQRGKRTCWKRNLEDTLAKYSLGQPEDFFTEMNESFAVPSSRQQLLVLLNCCASQDLFPSHAAAVLASHPLLSSLLMSLLVDNSSTVCTSGLTVISKLLPILAVHATDGLKAILPPLLVILARTICWKERRPPVTPSEDIESGENADQEVSEASSVEALPQLRPETDWQRLEMTFTASSAPSPHHFFTYVYYLFPCNTIRFLRNPMSYINGHNLPSPYIVPWDEILDEDEIKSRSESILRGHVLHPRLLWSDAAEELTEPRVWEQYPVSRIVGECTMLDVRSASLALRARALGDEGEGPSQAEEDQNVATVTPHMIDLSTTPGRPRVSLREILTTSLALNSVEDVEIVDMEPGWPPELFPSAGGSPSKRSVSLPREGEDTTTEHGNPGQVVQAISALQREVLLLRNELNFETWVNRENAKHIGRLHQDRILSRSAEIERQGLHNKLREYKTQVNRLRNELKQYKEQSNSAKQMYVNWNTEQQNKLRSFREKWKSWQAEATNLRNENKEAKAHLEAQETLLGDAARRVFELETATKENQHKIDRLHDYERRIDQLTKMQRLWDEDVKRCNEQAQIMEGLLSTYKKMELRLEAYEKTHAEMEDNARAASQKIQELEARLSLAQRDDTARQQFATEVEALNKDRIMLVQDNKALRASNNDLRDEVLELEHMIELLKAQVSGKRGLVAERPSTPPSMT
ncbi:hypothetical protein GLOTRDRAFT_72328 [Gloeophyllum trabeum ATCC 11539]|uniref:Tuberous sclerosis 1 n=1 Tax=Gloeophyllum trabeum (strain ATCC 11539 / FP-39264 / Madison 617) TaxID=670483 RepID=S7QFJ2_GLOTA|nr:uncharacterized protein GLOTRDRAFT_72328 [Gloeophyllum trabeum ATCC 11539]EPQ58187.1 hypothetical protein GLOTRDRAFT_72328 [Gloeophyllum trabeum ATCC 11539]